MINCICIGNSMICSDIWHKYQEWYFKIVLHNLGQFWNITSGIYAKYQVQFMLFMLVYTTTWEIQSSLLSVMFIFVELFRFVGEQIGLEVLIFGPAGPKGVPRGRSWGARDPPFCKPP